MPLDRDTFDSRPHPPKPRRDSRHSRDSRDRHREHRRSRRSEELPWPAVPEWNHVEAPPEERRKKGKCCKRIGLYISLVFLAAYFALVALLVSMVLSERQLLEAPGGDSPECQKMICPIDSKCLIQENEARCVFVSMANLQAIEVILGLVVGVPLLICVPCTCHWFFRKMHGKSWGPKRASKGMPHDPIHGTVVGRQDEEISEDSNKALKPSMAVATEPPTDDGLDDLFTPLAKNLSEDLAVAAAEDELDLLFAPKPHRSKVQTSKPKAPSVVSSAMESEFSALFHQKPASKKKGPVSAGIGMKDLDLAMSDLHSNFSEGMSVLFASLKQLQRTAADTKSAASSHQLSPKMPAESPDWLDEDLGDPPDFFNYALKIAAKATGNIRDEDAAATLSRTPSEDSLGHLEPDDLTDLFHPPLGSR